MQLYGKCRKLPYRGVKIDSDGAVVIALERGVPPRDIARQYGVCIDSVHKARRRFEDTWGRKVRRVARLGRPRKQAAA